MNTNNHTSIRVNGLDVHIERKEIKNLHVGVYPPHGRVRVAAPLNVDDEAVRLAVISRLSWIKKHVRQFQEQKRESKREMVSGESHYFFGKRYLLDVKNTKSKHKIILNHSTLELYVRPNTSTENRQLVLNEWYREQLKCEIEKFIIKWEKAIGVKLLSWSIKKMKTKWGSCNIDKKSILLNLELVKVPVECIEYIVVHEMVHLLERHHNDNFKVYMDRFLPEWKNRKSLLDNCIIGV